MKPASEALKKEAERHNPRARMILESVKVTDEDIKDTNTEWSGADSLTGWDVLNQGGARPAGSVDTMVELTINNGDAITTLPHVSAATLPCVVVEWAATSEQTVRDIKTLTARLDPNTGAGKNVDTWTARMYRVFEVSVDKDDLEQWGLELLTAPVVVTAGGAAADVVFTFDGALASVGAPPNFVGVGTTPTNLSRGKAATVVVITALQSDGSLATAVAWEGDTTDDSATNNSHVASRYDLGELNTQAGTETVAYKSASGGPTNGLPRFAIKSKTFTAQTIEFTGANAPTLSATPTNTVEFQLEHTEQGFSSGQGYVRNDGSTTWVAFTDGQTTADLAGVSTTGPVYEMRYIATPSTGGLTVPTVHRLGVRELVRETLSGISRIGNPTYSMDPFTLKCGIPTLSLELTRDGINDYRDFATELFSDQHAGEIEFRVSYGTTAIDRKDWVYVDQFRLNNYDTAGDTIQVDAVHPLALIKKTIPVGTTAGQAAIVYSGSTDTVESVAGGILSEAGFPDRYNGVDIQPLTLSTAAYTAPLIGKTLSEPRIAKDELDRVAFIDGVAVIPSQGRLRAQRIWSSTGGLLNSPVEHFDNIAPISVSPHMDRRIISYRAPYSYDRLLNEGQGGYASAAFVSSTAAVAKLGHADMDPVQDLPDETAKWLQGSTYAKAIVGRTVSAFRQGALAIKFKSDHPRPWLELGDTVEVKTDRFVGRTLDVERALRGRLSVSGPIIEHDMNGTEFTVWVPDIGAGSFVPNTINIDYGRPLLTISPVRAVPITSTFNYGAPAFQMEFDVYPNRDCKAFILQSPTDYTHSNQVGTGTALRKAGWIGTGAGYVQNLTGALQEKITMSRPGTKLYTSTATVDWWKVMQDSTGGYWSDTEDALGFGTPIPYNITPLSIAQTTAAILGSSATLGTAGTVVSFTIPRLKEQIGSAKVVNLPTANAIAGSQIELGAGLSLSRSTGGEPKIDVSTLDLDIPVGSVTGVTSVHRFGRNPDVDTATDPETIWSAGGLQQISSTGASAIRVWSGSGEDSNSTGSGAWTLRVYGLKTWATTQVSEDFTLAAATVQNSTNTYVYINRAKVLTGGTDGVNQGDIFITDSTGNVGGAKYQAYIAAGAGQTLQAAHGVPSVRDAYMTNWYASMNKIGAVGTAEVEVKVNEDPGTNPNLFLTKGHKGMESEGTSTIDTQHNPYVKYPGPCIIRLDVAEVSANNSDISGGFDLILKSNT